MELKSNTIHIILAPLVYISQDPIQPRSKIVTLIGIVSWSGDCGYDEYPDVYASIRDAIKWIEKETSNLALSILEQYLMIHFFQICNVLEF